MSSLDGVTSSTDERVWGFFLDRFAWINNETRQTGLRSGVRRGGLSLCMIPGISGSIPRKVLLVGRERGEGRYGLLCGCCCYCCLPLTTRERGWLDS